MVTPALATVWRSSLPRSTVVTPAVAEGHAQLVHQIENSAWAAVSLTITQHWQYAVSVPAPVLLIYEVLAQDVDPPAGHVTPPPAP